MPMEIDDECQTPQLTQHEDAAIALVSLQKVSERSDNGSSHVVGGGRMTAGGEPDILSPGQLNEGSQLGPHRPRQNLQSYVNDDNDGAEFTVVAFAHQKHGLGLKLKGGTCGHLLKFGGFSEKLGNPETVFGHYATYIEDGDELSQIEGHLFDINEARETKTNRVRTAIQVALAKSTPINLIFRRTATTSDDLVDADGLNDGDKETAAYTGKAPPPVPGGIAYFHDSGRIKYSDVKEKAKKHSIYVRTVRIPKEERAEFNRAIEQGFTLPSFADLGNLFHIGQTEDMQRRLRSESAPVEHDCLVMVTQDRKRLEVFWLYVNDERGLRRGRRDYFALTEDIILEMEEKTALYNKTFQLQVNFTDKKGEERSEDIRTFANADNFDQWWKNFGGRGMPKPEKIFYPETDWNENHPSSKNTWKDNFEKLLAFIDDHGKEPSSADKIRGFDVGGWFNEQKYFYKSNPTDERFKIFQDKGIDLNADENVWTENFHQIIEFREEEGRYPNKNSDRLGECRLGKWFHEERKLLRRDPDSPHGQKFDEYGLLSGKTVSDSIWKMQYNEIVSWLKEKGMLPQHFEIWYEKQRNIYSLCRLQKWKIDLLNKIKFEWGHGNEISTDT